MDQSGVVSYECHLVTKILPIPDTLSAVLSLSVYSVILFSVIQFKASALNAYDRQESTFFRRPNQFVSREIGQNQNLPIGTSAYYHYSILFHSIYFVNIFPVIYSYLREMCLVCELWIFPVLDHLKAILAHRHLELSHSTSSRHRSISKCYIQPHSVLTSLHRLKEFCISVTSVQTFHRSLQNRAEI
ncbi:hypothetical protein CEXT_114541 [Caerostris extrusa]|uniref:Uncharacterized protein n=1 Tax=Caerostris extrusa TaxID=172846 RepID=A0AAV4X3R2_CAEEX|nr:hypothetical protein CEXT_114541 [Caerostris extrusa]